MKITALLLFALSFCYSQDLPVLEGRWKMDIENLRILLREHEGEHTEEFIKKELVDDRTSGKDAVFKGDTISFCNEDRVARSHKYRLYYNDRNILRIELLIMPPYLVRLYTLDLKGDQMVFRSTVDNKFELYMAYKRVNEEGE